MSVLFEMSARRGSARRWGGELEVGMGAGEPISRGWEQERVLCLQQGIQLREILLRFSSVMYSPEKYLSFGSIKAECIGLVLNFVLIYLRCFRFSFSNMSFYKNAGKL